MIRMPLLGGWRRGAGQVPVGLPGPDALEVGPRSLRAGTTLHRTLAVTGYPREVGPGWLQPLLDHPGPVDVALHLEPVPTTPSWRRPPTTPTSWAGTVALAVTVAERRDCWHENPSPRPCFRSAIGLRRFSASRPR